MFVSIKEESLLFKLMNRGFGKKNVYFSIFRRFTGVTDRNGGNQIVFSSLISLYFNYFQVNREYLFSRLDRSRR